MLRTKQIMKRIVNELGDEFNEYIEKFYICDLWKLKENELIVNKTFKRLVEIIADFNLTTSDNILEDAYKLIESNEAMMHILSFLCDDFIRHGNQSLLNRTMVFCYAVFIISAHNNISATDVLNNVIESEVLTVKNSILYKVKYWLKLSPRPYHIKGDPDALMLISILKGSPATDTIKEVADYKEI